MGKRVKPVNFKLPYAGGIIPNIFDASGNFNVTNAVVPGAPRSFFTIQLQ